MPSNTDPKTILLFGNPARKERRAAGAITPGMLIQTIAAGTVQAHSAAAGYAQVVFAAEADYVGTGIDTAYAAGERVQCLYSQPGDEVYGLLAAGSNVANNAILESNGAGALQALSGVNRVCRALEAVDNSGGGAPVRIRVEVL